MPPPENVPPSFSATRRWAIVLNVILSAIAVLGLAVIVNYLSAGYFKRLQWTTQSQLDVSAQTTRLLQLVTNEVNVTIFFDPKAEEDLYSWVSGLLREYSFINEKIRVRTVDYSRFPGDAELVLSKYKITNLKDKDFVVFDSVGGKKVVFANELSDYDITSVISGKTKEFRRAAFKGELLFSSAIFSVTYLRPQKAYFLYGHAEHDPRNDGDIQGYGKFAAIVREENNVEWDKLLLHTNDVPADCQLLIIAGPAAGHFSAEEQEKIEKYLKQGGRLFVMMNNMVRGGNSGIEGVLSKWGIGVANSTVFESPEYSPNRNDLISAKLNPAHPIMKPMVADNLRVYLVLPRAVGPTSGPKSATDAPKVEILVATSDEATEQAPSRADGLPPASRKGSFPLVAAAEQGSIQGVSTGARIVVVGDSLCFDNQLINSAANAHFVHRAIDWLLDRPPILLSGLTPRPVQEYTLRMTRTEMTRVHWLLLAGLPGIILLIGGLVWWRRRS